MVILGRASAVPARDLVLTLLFLGRKGLLEQFDRRVQLYTILKEKLSHFADSIGEQVLNVPQNGISLGNLCHNISSLLSLFLAMTLESIPRSKQTLFG